MPLILTEFRNSIGTLTLNHDEKRNSLSEKLIDEFVAGLEHLRALKARVVVLRAKPGTKVWSAGHDIAELPRSGRDPLAYSDPLERGIRLIRTFPAPIIALIEGSVWGGACELILCCDLRIGAPSASFALTPVRVGVPYNASGILRITNALPAAIVNEMFFTGAPLGAERAAASGILNHLIPEGEIEAFTQDMASRMTDLSPLSIAVIKEQLRVLRNAHPINPEAFERIQGLRRKVYDSRDYREGITAFLEKRKPVFTGE